jgi:hypothetical protein
MVNLHTIKNLQNDKCALGYQKCNEEPHNLGGLMPDYVLLNKSKSSKIGFTPRLTSFGLELNDENLRSKLLLALFTQKGNKGNYNLQSMNFV